MNWLAPSIIATASGTAILASLYFYLYYNDRRKYLAVWACSWTIYFMRFLFMLTIVAGQNHSFFLIANQTTSLLSGVFLLWGTYLFIQKEFPSFWIWGCAVGICWIIASILLHFSFLVMSIPTFTFLAVIYVWTGVKFIQIEAFGGHGKIITGFAFIAWGVHKANYPFLRTVDWFAPWGYLIAAILGFVVALGMLLVYFHKIRSDLKQEQLFLRKAQEIGKIGTWTLNREKNELLWTDEAYKIFGLPNGTKLDYETFLNCVHPDDREFVASRWKAASDKIPYDIEHRIRVNGEVKWVREKAEFEYDEKGGWREATGSVQDITDRKSTEEELRKSEEKYRAIFENANEGILIAQRGKVKLANPMVEKITGYCSDELTSKLFTDFIHPEDRDTVFDRYRRRMAGENVPTGYEFRVITKSGEERCVEIHSSLLNWEGNLSTLNFIQDTTERKLVEDALRESEQRLHAILESNANPIVVYDADGFPRYLNPAFTEVFGWTLDELSEHRIPFVPEGHKEVTEAKIKEIYSSGVPVRFVSQRLTKQGKILDVIVSAAIIKGGKGDGTGMVVNLIDISEQRKLEKQFRQAQKMESVGRLAGGVAHDFNNMLSVILGYTEMALEQVDPNQSTYASLREIHKAAERSSSLTKQLLAFARKQTIAPKVLDLNETVEGMLKMLRRLIGEDIDLVWLPESKIWPIRIDPAQIDQILANLCVNARDAITDVGKVTIKTGKTTLDEAYSAEHPDFTPGDFVILSVSDDGIGMDQQTLNNLFEPFFTTKDMDKGTGLGLATVYGIVKQNRGFVNVSSTPGQGTTFHIYLPRYETTTEPTIKKKPAVSDAQNNETILLVEDEAAILKMTQTMLEGLGYTVLSAKTPGEAIALAREHTGKIHLLLTDIVMPEMNGRDLAKNLLSIYPNLKRLFMSGYTANVIAHHGVLDEGMNYIQKPFTRQDLSIKVRGVLENI